MRTGVDTQGDFRLRIWPKTITLWALYMLVHCLFITLCHAAKKAADDNKSMHTLDDTPIIPNICI